MKEKLKNITRHKWFKIAIVILFWLFVVNEFYSMSIDRYNFGQLERVKWVLKNNNIQASFRDVVDFNGRYNESIEPLKNCHYLSSDNWTESYIFWFKIESLAYQYIYWTKYFSYPKYDLPISKFCFWVGRIDGGSCYDVNKERFLGTISNPCRWHISWYVYNDKNKNGIKDIWEDWIEGLWIQLEVSTVYTDKNGYYSFWDLRDWNYDLQVRFLKNWYVVYPRSKNNAHYIDIKDGVVINNVNFWVIDRNQK